MPMDYVRFSENSLSIQCRSCMHKQLVTFDFWNQLRKQLPGCIIDENTIGVNLWVTDRLVCSSCGAKNAMFINEVTNEQFDRHLQSPNCIFFSEAVPLSSCPSMMDKPTEAAPKGTINQSPAFGEIMGGSSGTRLKRKDTGLGGLVYCRQCNGDGGATGQCPRCGGNGIEPR